MANLLLTPATIVKTGLSIVFVTSLNTGDTVQFANDGRALLLVRYNGSGATVSVSAATPAVVSGVSLVPPTKTLTGTVAAKLVILGPFEPEIFNNATGLVTLTFTIAGATVNVYALRI